MLELPLRAVPPYAEMYLDGGAAAGVIETDLAVRRAALERAWRAARQERMRPLAERLHALLAATDPGATMTASSPPVLPGAADTQRVANALLDAPAAPSEQPPTANPAALDQWVVGTAAISTRLLPLLEAPARHMVAGSTDGPPRCWRPASARGAGQSCCSRRTRRRLTSWRSPR